jgi:hypothetical protein
MKPGLPDIRHRLQSIHYLEFIIDWQKDEPFEPIDISILAESRPPIITKSILVSGPIIDVGVISMRILLEFMGLKFDNKNGSLTYPKERRKKPDDIIIEDFMDANNSPLKRVSKMDITKMFPKKHETAVKAFVLTIQNAHKGSAHLTTHRVSDPYVFDMYLCAAEGIRRLMKHHFYSKRGQ